MSTPTSIGTVAHYNLLERLDPAGPGDLYRARDTHRGRTVVVRLLPATEPATAQDRAALIDRAQALVTLSHPNVITLFEAGEHEGRVYLAFEYVRGQSLRAEMAGRPMNVRHALDLSIQVADAVAAAHASGFIHGGLSPETIAITAKGHAKIPAFDLAAVGGYDARDGVARLRDYDSPEEARGTQGDDRSDIYSVAAILYEMLTARRPMHRGASAPSASNPHVPKELDDVILKALAPNPDLRYQAAPTLAGELRGVAATIDARGGAGDEDDLHETATSVSRVVVVALLMLLGIAAVAWWITRS